MCRPRSSSFTGRKSNKQEEKKKYQSTELKRSWFNFKWNGYGHRWGGCDRENHYNSMMPPEKKNEKRRKRGGGGGGAEVQGGTDLLPLYRSARQVLSAPPPPPPPPPPDLSHVFFPSLKSAFSLIPLIWEKQPDSHPQSPGWACLLSQAPSLGRSFLWSLIFGKPSSLNS